MSFISYSQNFEDVMLWRALKHIKNGYYIDVGAQHPVIDSVSKAFYENGWSGINIEPVPAYADLLRKDRPRDTVLEVAISDIDGTLELNIIPETGLSTAVDIYAKRHQVERGYTIEKLKVPVLTLETATKSLEIKDVHWLKIDVEGLEDKVLKGWNSIKLRPWVMVVESTIPNSQEEDYASWENILLDTDYQFVYFDGLNRFYVAKEHSELIKAFSYPPNVFDDFVMFGIIERDLKLLLLDKKNNLIKKEVDLIKNELDSTVIEIKSTKTQLDSTNSELNSTKSQLESKTNELLEIYNSRGWKMVILVRKGVNAIIPIGSYRRRAVKHFLKLFKAPQKNKAQSEISNELKSLSPRARRIYHDLNTAINNRKKNK